MLCDTNGGTLPERVAEITRLAKQALGDLEVEFGIHTHNDGAMAVANSLAAVDAESTKFRVLSMASANDVETQT